MVSRRRFQDLRQALLAALAVAACLLVLEVVRPYYFLQDDNRDDFLPLFVHNLRALRGGRLALFNFHQYLGLPHLAAGQTAALYPPVYLALAASRLIFGHVFAGIDLLVVFHLAVGAAGAFALLRRLGAAEEAALFGALTWALNPFSIVVSSFWVTVSPTVALLPWTTLLSLRTLDQGRPEDIALLVGARALLFYAGYVEYFLYAVLFEAAFAAAVSTRRRAARWLASFPLTALACLPLLLPLLGQVRVSAERSGALPYLTFANDDARPRAWLLGLLWPFPYGPGRLLGFSKLVRPISHLGWAGAALAAYGAARSFREKSRAAAASVALAALALAWAFGWLDRALYALPILNRFRFHLKLLLPADFFLVVLAAAAFGRLRLSRQVGLALVALQAANLLALAATTPAQCLIVDVDRPPLSEPLRAEISEGRIASLGTGRPAPSRYAPTLGFNYATLWGLYHFAGYDPLVPIGHFVEAYGANEDALLNEAAFEKDFPERMRRWGVRWLVVQAGVRERYAAALKALGARPRFYDAERVVYETSGALPLAYWQDGRPGRPPEAAFAVNEAWVDVDDARGGRLVVSVLRQAGFSAAVDGRPAPLFVTDDRQFAVDVPPGRHRVALAYEEPAFLLGLALAAAGALAFGLWAARARRRER